MLRTTLDRIELTGTTRHPVAWLIAFVVTGSWALVALSLSDSVAGDLGWVWLDAFGRELSHTVTHPEDVLFRIGWRVRSALRITWEAIQTGDPAHLLGSWTLLGWLRQVLSMGLLGVAAIIGSVAAWQGWQAWCHHQPMVFIARTDGVTLDGQHADWAELQRVTLEGDRVVLVTRDGTRLSSAPLGYEAAAEADAVCQDVMDRLATLHASDGDGQFGGDRRDVPNTLITLQRTGGGPTPSSPRSRDRPNPR